MIWFILYVLGLICFYIPLGFNLNNIGYFKYYDKVWQLHDSRFTEYLIGSFVWPLVLLGMGSYYLMKCFFKDKN